MKQKEQIRKIRQSDRPWERLELAAGKGAGVKFEQVIFAADMFDPASDGDEEARALNNTWRRFLEETANARPLLLGHNLLPRDLICLNASRCGT